jgi:carboxymethylenebutenolidase
MMRVFSLLLCGCLIEAEAVAGVVQDPELLSAPDVSPAVWGVVEEPPGPGPSPGVILLHGSAGWRSVYADLARMLADSGFATLALDYYAEIGSAAIGSDEKLQKWPQWKETVRNAVAYLQASPSVSRRPIGLVGFSRGAFLAVSVASSVSGLEAVVDFFGGGGGGTDSLSQEVQGLPALLILHGEADQVVPVRFAYELRGAVLANGGEVDMHLYPGAGHAFNAPYASTYSQAAAADSFRRTVGFLRKHLER